LRLVDIATIAQAVAVIAACWAIISGVGAWKREFIGKRQIELAEQVLAKFFEVNDAIAFIRNPFSSADEGKSRKRNDSEDAKDSELLDRGYIVFERYQKKQAVFSEFNVLKYRFMATFGVGTENIFVETNRVLNSIFISARMLSTHYWKRQERIMGPDEFYKHLDEMHRHEGIFWDTSAEDDKIRSQLSAIQAALETVTAPCFQEPIRLYSFLTKRWNSMAKTSHSGHSQAVAAEPKR
jgi:hypothetical protein